MSMLIKLSKKDLLEGLSRSMSRRYKLRLKEYADKKVGICVNDTGEWLPLKEITLEVGEIE